MKQQLKVGEKVLSYLYGKAITSHIVSSIRANVDDDYPDEECVFFKSTELEVWRKDVVRIGEQVNNVGVTIHKGDSWGVLLHVKKPQTEVISGYNLDGSLKMVPLPEPGKEG
jgi:hypothetical protein